jgi:hypothetical protein
MTRPVHRGSVDGVGRGLRRARDRGAGCDPERILSRTRLSAGQPGHPGQHLRRGQRDRADLRLLLEPRSLLPLGRAIERWQGQLQRKRSGAKAGSGNLIVCLLNRRARGFSLARHAKNRPHGRTGHRASPPCEPQRGGQWRIRITNASRRRTHQTTTARSRKSAAGRWFLSGRRDLNPRRPPWQCRVTTGQVVGNPRWVRTSIAACGGVVAAIAAFGASAGASLKGADASAGR